MSWADNVGVLLLQAFLFLDHPVALAAYQIFSSALLVVFAATVAAAPVFMQQSMGIEWTASRELLTRCTGALLFIPMSLAESMKVSTPIRMA